MNKQKNNEQDLEYIKLMIDVLRHISSYTASVVIVSTIAFFSIFDNIRYGWVAFLSILFVVFCGFVSLQAQLSFIDLVKKKGNVFDNDKYKSDRNKAITLCLVFFVVSIGLFSIFIIINISK